MTKRLKFNGQQDTFFQDVGLVKVDEEKVYLDSVAETLLKRGDFTEVVPKASPKDKADSKLKEDKSVE